MTDVPQKGAANSVAPEQFCSASDRFKSERDEVDPRARVRAKFWRCYIAGVLACVALGVLAAVFLG